MVMNGRSIDGLSPRKKTEVTRPTVGRVSPMAMPSRQAVPKIQKKRRVVSYSNEPMMKTSRSAAGLQNTTSRRPGATYSRHQVEQMNRTTGRLASTRDETIEKKIALHREATADFLRPVESFDIEERPRLKPKTQKITKEEPKQSFWSKIFKKKHKSRRKIPVIIGLVFVILIGVILVKGQGWIANITSGESSVFDLIGAAFNDGTELKEGMNGRTNALIFGTSGYEMSGSDHDGAQLTDSIMLLSFDQETKDLAMVSFPRDLYWGNTCTSTGKINELYWCANQNEDNEAAGAEALKSAIEEISGVDIQYYAHVDWGALVQIVDAVGGITVTLDESIADEWTNTYINAGEAVTLNGEQALGLARARHGTEQGDFTRGNSQQKILMALQEKVVQNGISVVEALNLVNVLGDNLRTDMQVDEMRRVFKLANEMDLSNMRQIPLTAIERRADYVTSTEINSISYVIPTAGINNYEDIKKYLTKSFSSDPAIREEANIMILNGSGVEGAASNEQSVLESLGYNVGSIGNAPDGEYPSQYYLYDITGTKSATKLALEEKYDVTAQSGEIIPEGIITDGYDFVIILGNTDNGEVIIDIENTEN